MNVKLKALAYTVVVMAGLIISFSVVLFLLVNFVTLEMMQLVFVGAAVIMAGMMVYDKIIDSLKNTVSMKHKRD